MSRYIVVLVGLVVLLTLVISTVSPYYSPSSSSSSSSSSSTITDVYSVWTVGEKCKENYYMDTRLDKCVACNCDPIGSINQQCSGTGHCACKSGVNGKRCDRCATNYFDFSPSGCRPCNCNAAGCVNNIASCDNLGQCLCKKNVEGDRCDRCKSGFFDLQWNNEFGCTPCFCNGHSNVCTSSAGFALHRIESTFNRDSERWTARDKQGIEVPFQYNTIGRSIGTVIGSSTTNTNNNKDNPVYFYAPEKFLGNKQYSYDRNLSFSLQVNGENLRMTMEDLVIEGNGIRISSPIFGQGNPIPTSQRTTFKFRLNEDTRYGWTPQLSTREFMSILSNITAIKIKATYTGSSGSGSIDDVTLETAIQTPGVMLHEQAGGVETCTCPEGYDGQHCDSCAAGYKRDPPRGGKFARCVPCVCNKDGEYCDSESAMYCDKCVKKKENCDKCECNENVDSNAVGNCDSLTGECRRCIFNTWGFSCEKCLPGYYGSALTYPKGDCKACACNLFGTYPEENLNNFNDAKRYGYLRHHLSSTNFFSCNPVNGQCNCKPNVAGRQCSACVDGYWGLSSNQGCKACNCDMIGSVNPLCDDRTGQCQCRPGVTGLQCDQCLPAHYGFGTQGCQRCDCDPTGSLNSQCDPVTGQCKCRPNVEGKHCERCEENKYNKEAGCIDCPPCYTLVQESVSAHRLKVNELKQMLDAIEQSPHEVGDANFERQLNEVINTVKKLLDEAKDAQGIDDSLMYQLEQIKARVRKVQETTKKITTQMDFINTNIGYGVKNISYADEIATSAENDLNNARNYLENDGHRALEKARIRSERFGHQSERMSEIARESRLLADNHEKVAENVISSFKEARNISETAYNLAKDAINTQKANKEELDRLRHKLDEVKDQYQLTRKLSQDVHRDATNAEQDALGLFTEISNIKVPDLNSARYKMEALQILEQARSAFKDANAILASHAELLNSTGNRLKDSKALYQEAVRQQQITDRLLAEANAALNQTKEAIKDGENILNDAKKTLQTLKEFDKNVQASKEKAREAQARIPQIEQDIEAANALTEKAKNALHLALSEAINARDLAKSAENRAQAASNESKKIRADAQETKEKVNSLNVRSNELLRDVDATSERMKGYENQAQTDEKLAQDALEMANTAKTSAEDAINKVDKATRTVDDILRNLNSMDDMDEKYLFDLEQRLREAEKDLKNTDLDQRVSQLEKLYHDQKHWIKNYEDEVNKLAADVANIAKIRESLPDGCFRRMHLEP